MYDQGFFTRNITREEDRGFWRLLLWGREADDDPRAAGDPILRAHFSAVDGDQMLYDGEPQSAASAGAGA